MFRSIFVSFMVLVAAGLASAQPTNVRAWYAQGQAFVVWEFPAPPVNQTDTVEIYASAAAQVTTANMTRVGRMFFPEYTGSRLQDLQANARLGIPTPAGGLYRLAVNEGVFVYTPHSAGFLFFAVVDTGSVLVNAGNSTSTAFNYDPVNEPVRPHPQFSGTTAGGNPYTAFVVWADGQADPNNARPDIPVLANSNKNGVPHVFTITGPVNPLPAGPVPVGVALHGGEGEYQLFRPGVPARSNISLGLTDGIIVTPDDSVFANVEGVLERSNSSWFGYVPSFDPFDSTPRQNPPDGTTVVNYTSRRVHWILDWLQSPNSPFTIDTQRVAIVGHSGGGRGTSHLVRQRPERFCAAISYTPASDLSIASQGRVNYLQGDWVQNLPTNLIGPGGATLGVTDVFTMTTRLSPTERDLPVYRYYYGKRDQEGPASWTPEQRAILDSLNDSRLGFMIYWDEREHGVEKWDNETPDGMDGNPDPWPDVGQWIVPPASIGGPKTVRARVQYLVDTYRAGLSYPGFFNSDSETLVAGRQPDPGPGDPSVGDPWGTWTGYFEWESGTIVDAPGRWEVTLYATGSATTAIDNSPFAEITTDLAPRRTTQFNPPEGATIDWFAFDVSSGVELQSGTTTSEADGVIVVTGLIVPRDPDRVRLVLCRRSDCTGDANNDNLVNFGDIAAILASFGVEYSACSGPGDSDASGTVDFTDVAFTLANFGADCN